MDLILLVVVCAIVGFLVWLLTTKVPMPPYWAVTIQVLALIVLVLYVLTRVLHVPNVL
jgi:hypothetical protein